MIDAYKIFTGKYDTTVTSWLTGKHVESKYNLRNHRFSMHLQLPIHFDMRKFSFTNRILLLCGKVYPIEWFQLIR